MATDKTKALALAQQFIDKGEHNKAVSHLEAVCKAEPEDLRNRLKLGDAHRRAGNHRKALTTLQAVAECYINNGFMLKSVAVFKQMLRIDGGLHTVHIALARVYHQLGLNNDAASQYQEAIRVLGQRGQTTERLELIRELLDLDPENIRARIRLGEDFIGEKMILDAVVQFKQAAEALHTTGHFDEYVRVAERLVFYEESDTKTLLQLVSTYLNRSDPHKAMPHLQAAFKIRPGNVEVLELLARTFELMGQGQKAVTVLREIAHIHGRNRLVDERDDVLSRILSLDPTDQSARQALGQTMEDDGDNADGQMLEINFDDNSGSFSGLINENIEDAGVSEPQAEVGLSPLPTNEMESGPPTVTTPPPLPFDEVFYNDEAVSTDVEIPVVELNEEIIEVTDDDLLVELDDADVETVAPGEAKSEVELGDVAESASRGELEVDDREEPAAEVEPEEKTEPESSDELEVDSDREVDADAEAEPEVIADVDLETLVGPETSNPLEAETEMEPTAELEPEIVAEDEPESESNDELEVELEVEAVVEVESEAIIETKDVVESETITEPNADPLTDADSVTADEPVVIAKTPQRSGRGTRRLAMPIETPFDVEPTTDALSKRRLAVPISTNSGPGSPDETEVEVVIDSETTAGATSETPELDDGLREIDFYVSCGLIDEAAKVLLNLEDHFGSHAGVIRRRKIVDNYK
jgi:tetratricopeptide (TPR) repeat protein